MPAVKKSAKAAAKPAAKKDDAKPEAPKVEKAAATQSDQVNTEGPVVLSDGRLVVDLAGIANSPQNEREAATASLRRLVDRFAQDPHGVIGG